MPGKYSDGTQHNATCRPYYTYNKYIIGLDWHDIKLDTQPNMEQILQ